MRVAIIALCVVLALPGWARQTEYQINIEKLVAAADKGDDQELQRLLELGTPVQALSKHGVSALFSACKAGHLSTVKLLLRRGADPHRLMGDGVSSLAGAAFSKNVELVKLLLEAGVEPDCSFEVTVRQGFERLQTPLSAATLAGSAEVVKLLLDHGLPARQRVLAAIQLERENREEEALALLSGLDAVDAASLPLLLHRAAADGSQQLLDWLCDRGGKPGADDLMVALRTGHEQVAVNLLKRGVRASAEHLEIALRFPEVVSLMLEEGVALASLDAEGHTLLMRAAARGYAQTVKTLLEYGADVHHRDIYGRDAIGLAAEHSRWECCRAFVERGADPWRTDHRGYNAVLLGFRQTPWRATVADDGWTLLHAYPEAVEELEIPVDVRDRAGWSPLMWAAYGQRPTQLKALLKAGADPNLKSPRGLTPLYLAAGSPRLKNSAAAVEVLLEAGADPNLAAPGGTPLVAAKHCRSEARAKALLKAGAGADPPEGAKEKCWLLKSRLFHQSLLQEFIHKLQSGELDSAQRLALEGLALYRLEPGRRAHFLQAVALVAATRGEREQAERYGLLAGEFTAREPGRVGNYLFDLASLFGYEGQLEQGMGLLEQAAELDRRLGRVSSLVKILIYKADLLRGQARFREAEQTLLEALEVVARDSQRALVERELGWLHYRAGRYAEALGYLQQARASYLAFESEVMSATAESDEEARILTSQGVVYQRLGQFEKAREAHQRALAIAREEGEGVLIGAALNNLALVEQDQGHHQRAVELFQQARPYVRTRIDGAILSGNLGRALRRVGRSEEALELLRTARQELSQRGSTDLSGQVALGLASALEELHQAHEAEVIAREVLDDFRRLGLVEGEADALSLLGTLALGRDRPDEALQHLQQAVDLYEEQVSQNLSPEERSGYLGRHRKTYETLIRLLLDQGRDRQALLTCERARSRALLDLLGNRRLSLEGGSPQLRNRLAALATQMDAYRRHGRKLYELKREYAELEQSLRRQAPEYASLQSIQPPPVEEILEALGPDTVMLEYFVGSSETVVWVLRSTGLTVHRLPIEREALRRQISRARRGLRQRDSREPLLRLSELLLHPLEAELGHPKRLVVIPHQELHYIPFAGLTFPDGSLTLEHFSIETSASAATWLLARHGHQPSAGGVTLAALGNHQVAWAQGRDKPVTLSERAELGPLPGSEKEIRTLATLYRTSPLLAQEMTSERVRRAASQSRLVHLATHGILDAHHPLFSGLAMSDTLVTVSDIFSWRLQAELVVLSACETAGGRLGEGDDLVGLTRAFQYAGARCVLASLWPVSDLSTVDWMTSFHGALKTGVSRAEAARRACLETREKYPHPYFWAPFVLYGNGGER